jgi:Domain of unknown function (DUF4395)
MTPTPPLGRPRSADPGLQRNFILQQGFSEPAAASCPLQYRSLLFQPRVVGLVVLVAVVLQEPWIFLALGVVLWWNALIPQMNPFDAVYNRTLALRPGGMAVGRAPAPRRFAQGMAGTVALAIGISLARGWTVAAVALQGLLIAALAALTLGGFCLGSFLFHLLRGRMAFARRTLPWARRG